MATKTVSKSTAPKAAYQARIDRLAAYMDRYLCAFCDADDAPLSAAIRYTLCGGGKRIRALLAYAIGEHLGLADELSDAIATSVEMIHAFTLVHDDLPAMDDDMLRRGQPTTHLVYGEAIAVLTGDALSLEAFHCLSQPSIRAFVSPENQVAMVRFLSAQVGARGTCLGQAIDMDTHRHQHLNREMVQKLHTLKTGTLFKASILLPAIAAGLNHNQAEYRQLDALAEHLGFAFQLADDLLDLTSTEAQAGKAVNKDAAKAKGNYAVCFGVTESQQLLTALQEEVDSILKQLGGDTQFLRSLVDYLIHRQH